MSADGRSFEFDFQELVADWFAGGGGASEGIKEALGRDPDFAINHDGDALAMHTVNHPDTTHIESDVWVVDPAKVMGYRQIGLGWFSPDCKHFSKAKGGKPVSKKIRGLAWVIPRVAAKVKPRVIIMENVEEFKTWGPLKQIDGQWYPDPSRKGETFNRFVGRLKKLGYEVEHRELRACDYGTPTIRKRLFLIARRDGLPIVWPEPTHGNPKSLQVQSGKLLPWRTAAECIDWSIPCPSIFERKKPLAEATLRRIARGVMRYVVNSDSPFIVPIANYGSGLRVNSIDDPLTTVTANPKGGQHAVVVPHITKFRNGATGVGMDEPMPTVTANSFIKRPGGSVPIGCVSATLIQAAHGEGKPGGVQRWGDGTADIQQPVKTVTASNGQALVSATLQHATHGGRDHDLGNPISTVTGAKRGELELITATLQPTAEPPMIEGLGHAKFRCEPCGNWMWAKHAKCPRCLAEQPDPMPDLAAGFIERQFGNSAGNDADAPLGTVTAGGSGKSALLSATLVQTGYGEREGQAPRALDIGAPLGTVVGGGAKHAVVAAFLAQHNTMPNGGVHSGHAATEPVSTISASGAQQQVVTSHLIKLRGTCQDGQPVDAPAPTVTASGTHAGEVRAFLVKYYGTDQDPRLDEPMHTIPTKDRFGLVMVRGELYRIVDIGMRMLTPRELATAQGFPLSYIIDRRPDGTPLTKTAQVRMIGNSVCPPLAAALIRANFSHEKRQPAALRKRQSAPRRMRAAA